MFRRISAMAWKEYIHIIRDFRTLYLAIVLPVIMILLFGYAINFDIDHIPVGITDQDNSQASREFISRIQAGHWFMIKRISKDMRTLENDLDGGDIKIGLFIPSGFERSLNRGEEAKIQAIVDGSDNNAATTGINYLELYFSGYRFARFSRYLQRYNISLPARIDVRPLIYFNPEMQSRFFIMPGIIVLIVASMSALLTSLVIAKEWERGTMEQLISTPVRSHEIIIGKLLPYIIISLFQVALTVGMAVFLFGIPFRGSILALFFTSLLFAVAALGLGIFISAVLKSMMPAMQVALIASLLPSLFLSNFFFPVSSMPPVIRLVTYIVPAKYYLVMLRTIFLKGTGFEAYLIEMLFLVLFSTLIMLIASRRLVKRVA